MNRNRVVPTLALALSVSWAAPYMVSAQVTISGEPLESQIDNFEKVSNELWRGASPSDRAVEELANKGVKTIINLRLEGDSTRHEAIVAKKLGINYYNIPLGFASPDLEKVESFLNIVNNTENQPVFVHCRQGADRTGMLVAIYRILRQDWTFERTYKEMRTHHFKPFLVSFKRIVQRFATHELKYSSVSGVTREVASANTTKKGDKVALSRLH